MDEFDVNYGIGQSDCECIELAATRRSRANAQNDLLHQNSTNGAGFAEFCRPRS
jgi:hypothetical protein